MSSHGSEFDDGDKAMWVVLLTHLRSVAAICLAVPFTLLMSIVVIASGFAGRTRLSTKLVRFWGRGLVPLFGLKIEARGLENLPQAGGGIVVFNHQSHIDIPALVVSARANIRFGAKIELFKIPFFGAAMRAVGTLPIARQNRRGVLRIYRDAQARFLENIIFVLAPEGTRQNEPVIGRYKKGPFVFAVNAQVPLIPAVIKGAYHVMPKDRWSINVGRWTRTIYVEFLRPVSTKGLTSADVETLVQKVRTEMVTVYEGLPDEEFPKARAT